MREEFLGQTGVRMYFLFYIIDKLVDKQIIENLVRRWSCPITVNKTEYAAHVFNELQLVDVVDLTLMQLLQCHL